jgi:HPt (histidine-containing phosphotransfer) domain-containing protein
MPRAAPPADTPAFDPDVLTEMVAGLPAEALASVLRTFIDETRSRLDAVDDALASGDWPTVELHAHSVKSSAATFGAPALQGLSLSLEQAAASGQDARTRTVGKDLRPAAEAAISAIESYLEKLPG